jgi:dolichol-phosphate mannosyltransferase
MPPVIGFAWLTDRHAKPKLGDYVILFGVAFCVAAPWFVLVSLQDDQFLKEFFITHNVNRFIGDFHPKPIWFFVPVLLVAGHPWSFLTVSLTRFFLSRGDEFRAYRNPTLGFLGLCSGWCFLFFTLSKCKLPTYILPAAPGLAMIVGYFLRVTLHQTKQDSFRLDRFWSAKSATVTTCITALGFLIFMISTRHTLPSLTFGWSLIWTAILLGTLLMIREERNPRSAWTSTTIATGLLAIMMMHQFVPDFSRNQTLFGIGSPILAEINPGLPVATVTHEFSEVPFYLNRSDIAHWESTDSPGLREFIDKHDECVLVVNKDVSDDQLLARFPAQASATVIANRGSAKILRVVRSAVASVAIAADPANKSR